MAVPWLCCSAPRAVSTITRSAPAEQVGQRAQLVGRHPGDPLDPLGPPGRDRRGGRRRSRWCARRRTPRRRRRRRRAGAARPAPAARSVPGTGWRSSVGAVARSACAAGRSPRPCRRAPAAGRGAGRPAASSRRGWSRPAPRTSVCSTSASGNGSPRSRPKAWLPAEAAELHAPPAVVVDLAGAERDPGELAELVGLLVGQSAAAEDRDGVGPVTPRGASAAGRRPGRAPRPSRRPAARRSPGPAPAGWSAARGCRAARWRSSPCGTGRPR